MKTLMFAFAAAMALPLPAAAQAPAAINLEAVQPLSGRWTYRAIAGGTEADFIDASAVVRFQIRCNRSARTVSLVRGAVPAAAPTLTVWTSALSRTVPARYLPTRDLVADLSARDPLLDSIAFSRGRFATAASAAPMLAVTSAPEAARVIEDCRS